MGHAVRAPAHALRHSYNTTRSLSHTNTHRITTYEHTKTNASSCQARKRNLHAASSLTSAASTWSKLEGKSENYTITMRTRTLCGVPTRPTRSVSVMPYVVLVLGVVIMLLVAPRSGASSILSRGNKPSSCIVPLIPQLTTTECSFLLRHTHLDTKAVGISVLSHRL